MGGRILQTHRQWPERKSGHVWEPVDESWQNIDQALRKGLRSLHRGQSLARLLAKHRGKRNRKQLPKYTVGSILRWADDHHAQTGRWPRVKDGAIAAAPGETWSAVEEALRAGQRDLPSGSSLVQLLSTKRSVRNPAARPHLKVREIIRWADEHFRRTGNWPSVTSGPIPESKGDTWVAIALALRRGTRGLRPSSLFRLLAKERGVGNYRRRPALTVEQVLAWCDEHYARTGQWPKMNSGTIAGAEGESWLGVHNSLVLGKRGLPGGTSLARLLAKYRGVRSRIGNLVLSEPLILRWARSFKRRHGQWPERKSGPIPNTGGETWGSVHMALQRAGRGLKRRTTLTQLISSHR